MHDVSVVLILALSAVGASPSEKAPAQPASNVKQAPRVISHAGAGRWIPNLAFTDIDGEERRLSDFERVPWLVIAFTNASCPLCKKYAPTLARIEQEYSERGVGFLFVNPTPSDRTSDLQSMRNEQSLRGTYVHDVTGTLSAALCVRTTTEVLVLDSTRTVRYRGAIDDQYGFGYANAAPRRTFLIDALDSLLRGREPLIKATEAPGCALEFDSRPAAPIALEYHTRISRIVQAHCGECHRTKGVAPFSLDTPELLLSHKAMIKKVVAEGTMPPWLAARAPNQPSPWLNDRTLPQEDKADLLAWLDGDHALGDPAQAPAPRTFPEGWIIGEPDAIVTIPEPFEVPAGGVLPYRYARVEPGFDEDKWLQGVEIRPTDAGVVHHVTVFAIPKYVPTSVAIEAVALPVSGQRPQKNESATTRRSRASETRRAKEGRARQEPLEHPEYVANYLPGSSTLVYPDGFAKRLRKDSSLLFQIHYTPAGKATRDRTRLGLLFAKEAPRHEVRVAAIINQDIKIPAGAENHRETGRITTQGDMRLMTLVPHMHLRGKSCRFEVQFGNTPAEVLLDVPRYDFHWQLVYHFAEPVRIRPGSSLRFTAWYDNSSANPANPDPTRTVKWGDQTTEEMLLGIVEYYSEIPTEASPQPKPRTVSPNAKRTASSRN